MPARSRWLLLGVITVGNIQTHVHRMGFAPLIPTFVGDLGLTYAAAGAIQTAYFWTYMAAQVPIGVLSDRWGPRRVMATSVAVLVAGALGFAASRSYVEALVARMVVGLGAAAVWVPGMRVISEWFPPQERARATGLMSAGGGIGGTIGLIVVPWIASMSGWRVAYGTLAAPALAVLLVVILVLPAGGRGGAARVTTDGALRRVLTTRAVWALNVSVLCAYGGYFSFVTFLPAYLVYAQGMSHTQAGFVTSLVTAATIVSWPLAGLLSDRIGRRKAIYLVSQLASALVCVGFATVVEPLGVAGVVGFAVLAGLAIGGMILPFVMIVELFPAPLAATAAGVTNAACFGGAMILPIVLGRVVDVTGGFTASFLLAALVQGAGVVSAGFLTETSRRGYTRPE